MSLSRITPVLLTCNEEANVGRTLDSLRDFPRVVVVDSASTDGTEEIARSYPNVAWFVNAWPGFRGQWDFAFTRAGIDSPFVLALDADMSVPAKLVAELAGLAAQDEVDGALIGFDYRIRGVPLAGSLYPPQLRLVRLSKVRVGQSGHAHLLEVDGVVARLKARLVHDDRKPLESFVSSQLRYSAAELPRLFAGDAFARRPKSRLRRSFPFTPALVWILAWIRAGGPFRGEAAQRYALERLLYEALLRWRVEDAKLTGESGDGLAEGDPGGESDEARGRERNARD